MKEPGVDLSTPGLIFIGTIGVGVKTKG